MQEDPNFYQVWDYCIPTFFITFLFLIWHIFPLILSFLDRKRFNSLTKGLTNDIDKAKVIFEYVQLNIVYDYYYDTEKGAVKTLEDKKGNGADQAHLLVALYRAAGLKARYVHGYCTMNIDKKLLVTYGCRSLLTIPGFVQTHLKWSIDLEA